MNETLGWILLLLIKIIQTTVEFMAIATYGYVALLLWRKKVYNVNLSLLLVFLPIPSIIGILMYSARDLVAATNFSSEEIMTIIDYAQNAGMFGGALNLPNFVVDRLCATLMPVKYEGTANQFPIIAVAMITIQIFLTSLSVVACKIHLITDMQQTILFVSSCLLSAVVFSILPAITKRIHEYHRQKLSSISVRYQSVENLRAARLLNILMILYATFYISETTLYYIYYFFVTDYTLYKILMSTYIMLIAMEIFSAALVMAYSHQKLRIAMLCPGKKTEISTVSGKNVISADGRVLSFAADEEKKIYFEGYSTMWMR